MAEALKDVMENAVMANPKTWDIMVDYSTKHQAIKTWYKMTSGKPDISINIANLFPTSSNIL